MERCHFLDAKTSLTLGSLVLLAPSWASLAGYSLPWMLQEEIDATSQPLP